MSKYVLGQLYYLVTEDSAAVIANQFVSPQVVLPELSFWVWRGKREGFREERI